MGGVLTPKVGGHQIYYLAKIFLKLHKMFLKNLDREEGARPLHFSKSSNVDRWYLARGILCSASVGFSIHYNGKNC